MADPRIGLEGFSEALRMEYQGISVVVWISDGDLEKVVQVRYFKLAEASNPSKVVPLGHDVQYTIAAKIQIQGVERWVEEEGSCSCFVMAYNVRLHAYHILVDFLVARGPGPGFLRAVDQQRLPGFDSPLARRGLCKVVKDLQRPQTSVEAQRCQISAENVQLTLQTPHISAEFSMNLVQFFLKDLEYNSDSAIINEYILEMVIQFYLWATDAEHTTFMLNLFTTRKDTDTYERTPRNRFVPNMEENTYMSDKKNEIATMQEVGARHSNIQLSWKSETGSGERERAKRLLMELVIKLKELP
ncbi:hypothetical protein K438DRAFT_1756157 [Mycena galopus ATCC 62051]|nr:hypothetical protein K438DRAFT_1756157 [Mycena galopus ATCC 62051]